MEQHSTKALTPEQKKERAEAKALVRSESQRTTRGKRASFNGTEGKLRIDHQIDGYHLHIFNDTPGRVDHAVNVGYEFVSPQEVGGTSVNVVSRNTDIGDKVRFMVGTDGNNEPLYAYLMKIRQEFYDEDQETLQSKNDQIDEAIRGGKLTGDGQTTEGFYRPREGISLKRA